LHSPQVMKHPKKGDTIRIKDEKDGAIYEEGVFEVAPDPAHLPYGLKITVGTKTDYQKAKQYWIVGSDGEELGMSVESIQARNDGYKFTRFSTLIKET
jgi:hypothetical protein